jgi:aminotransferase
MLRLDDQKIPYVRPRGAFYVFPDMRRYNMSAKDITLYLLNKARVAVVPGDALGAAGEGHIRISLSTTYKEIESGMERMMEALDKLEKIRSPC